MMRSPLSRGHGWSHANDVRTARKMQRRAVFLCAIEQGVDRNRVARRIGISARTAKRYLQQERGQ